MTALLETRSLSKNFGALRATRDVTFALEEGARHALIGPNGAGKSTLLNLIAGMDKPTSGRLTVLGEEPVSMNERSLARWRNHHIGFVCYDGCH